MHELLSHLATLSPRGAIIWEARGRGGHVHYYLGADVKHIDKIEEASKAHGNIRFYDVPEHIRKPMATARQLKITKPTLSLNTGVSMSVIRAGLAAVAAVRSDEESVLQIVLGGAYAPSAVPVRMPDPNASWLDVVLGNVGQAAPELRAYGDRADLRGCHHPLRAAIRKSDYDHEQR